MKARNLLSIGMTALCCVLASCGGSNHGAPMQMVGPPPPGAGHRADADFRDCRSI